MSLKRWFAHTLYSCLLLLLLVDLSRSDNPNKRLEARRTLESIQIDGRLDERIWQSEGSSGFIQREPHDGQPASERTEVWVAYDEDALYVAARLYDSSPDSIIGRLARRDADSESDLFAVAIDASFDKRSGFYFAVNPAGAIQDGTYYSDSNVEPSWDGVWEVSAQTDGLGWIVEMRIPYSQLRFPKKEEYWWGIDFRRRIQRKNEESYFVYHPLNDIVRVSRWAELQGIQGISPPSRIELLPYVTATGKFLRVPPVDSFNEGRSDPFVLGRDYVGKVGADAKIGVSGDVTLDVTLNPDFAQVEVDPALVNLTAYETRYEEKRPFFIEGSNILSFGRGGVSGLLNIGWSDLSFFYSRRIGAPPQGTVTHQGFKHIPDRTTIVGATKISGKIDNTWSIAAITALTSREFGKVDSAGIQFSELIEPLSFSGVVRTQKEFNNARQGLGLISTYLERDLREQRLQDILDRRAVTVGVDGWSYLDEEKDWAITGWIGSSYVKGSTASMIRLQQSPRHYFQRPDAPHVSVDSNATSLTGWTSRFWLNKEKGNWRFNMAFGAVDPKFEANDLGFHYYSDLINTHMYGSYNWFEPDNHFRWKTIALLGFWNFNFGGYKTGETYGCILNAELLNYWGAYLYVGHNAESFDDQRTRGGPLTKSLQSQFFFFRLYSDSRRSLSGFLNFNGAKGRSGGWIYTLGLNLSWKASKTFNLSVGPQIVRDHAAAQWINQRTDPSATETFGRQYLFATLDRSTLSANVRLNWTFTPKLSFQLYAQPYIDVGKYNGLKELAKAGTYSFIKYGEGGSTRYLSDGKLVIDPDGEGPRPSFTFYPERDIDFSFTSLQLNAVLRWEYLPGSTAFFVWTNVKADSENYGEFDAARDFQSLLRNRPDNVFSIKITYWINP